MKDLIEARKIIDEIDSKIIELYEQRMDVVLDVIKYKIENDIPILDSNRESQMLDRNLQKIQNDDYRKHYKTILEGFLKASKDLQKEFLEKNK